MSVTSRTKNHIDVDTIQRLARANFGPAAQVAAVEELTGGMFNALYSVVFAGESAAGQCELVLKVGADPACFTLKYEKDIMASEVAVYERLTGTGVPAPRVVKADFTRKLINADYFFMEKLQGKTWEAWQPELTAGDTRRLRFALGRIVAEMHTLQNTYFGYDKRSAPSKHTRWSSALADMADLTLKDSEASALDLPYEEIRGAFRKHANLLDEIETPVLTCFDITNKNILLHKVDGRVEIEGLIDHERAFYGDPYADFISLRSAVGEIEQAEDFRAGYASFTGTPFVFTVKHQMRYALYDMYMGLLLAAEQYRYDEEVRPHVVQFGVARIQKNLAALQTLT